MERLQLLTEAIALLEGLSLPQLKKLVRDLKKPAYTVQMPFSMECDGPLFVRAWVEWKDYKKEQFRFTYKSQKSEQAALDKLAKHDVNTAIEMLKQSIENGWSGIFELKQKKNNGRTNTEGLRDFINT